MKIIAIVLLVVLVGCGSSQQQHVEQHSGSTSSKEPAAQNPEASESPSEEAETSEAEGPPKEIETPTQVEFGEGDVENVEATESTETPSWKRKGNECDDHNDCLTLCMLGCGTASCVEGYCKPD